jgi:hypothetical protein
MATRSKKVSKKRAAGKATRKARAKNVRQAALVKSLSRKGGSKRQTVSRARKAGVIEGEENQLSPRATKKWTG